MAKTKDCVKEAVKKQTLAQQLSRIVKKRGVVVIAEQTGLSVASIYSLISEHGNPRLSTLEKVITAINYQITLRRKRAKKSIVAKQ